MNTVQVLDSMSVPNYCDYVREEVVKRGGLIEVVEDLASELKLERVLSIVVEKLGSVLDEPHNGNDQYTRHQVITDSLSTLVPGGAYKIYTYCEIREAFFTYHHPTETNKLPQAIQLYYKNQTNQRENYSTEDCNWYFPFFYKKLRGILHIANFIPGPYSIRVCTVFTTNPMICHCIHSSTLNVSNHLLSTMQYYNERNFDAMINSAQQVLSATSLRIFRFPREIINNNNNLVSLAASFKCQLNIQNIKNDPRFRDQYSKYDHANILVTPIIDSHEVLVGVLQLISTNLPFGIFAESFAKQFCCMIATLIVDPIIDGDSEKAEPSSSSTSLTSDWVEAAMKRSLGTTHIIRILPSLIMECKELFASESCNIFVLNANGIFYTIVDDVTSPVHGSSTNYAIRMHEKSKGIVGRCLGTKTTIRSQNPEKDLNFDRVIDGKQCCLDVGGENEIYSLLCTPIYGANGKLLGVIEICNKKTSNSCQFTSRDEILLERFQSICGLAIENPTLHFALFTSPDNRQADTNFIGILIDKFGYLKEFSKHPGEFIGLDLPRIVATHYSIWLGGNEKLCTHIAQAMIDRQPMGAPDYIFKNALQKECRISYYVVAHLPELLASGDVLLIFESFGKVAVDENKMKEYGTKIRLRQAEFGSLYREDPIANYELPVTRSLNILPKILQNVSDENDLAEMIVECITILKSPDILVMEPLAIASMETNEWLTQEFSKASKLQLRSKAREKSSNIATSRRPSLRSRSPTTSPMTPKKAKSFRNDRRIPILNDVVTTPGADDKFRSFALDMFVLSTDELYDLALFIFKDFGLFDFFRINNETFCNWYNAIESNYRKNPFHNFLHALNVGHKAYLLIIEMNTRKIMDQLDLLVLLVASLSHDLDHPGLNNNYLVKSLAPLALLYNDISVLENHHACVAFEILKDPKSNILAALEPSVFMEARRSIINAILCTDMASHFELVAKFKLTSTKADGDKVASFDLEILTNLIVHAADLSNPILPWNLSKKWSDLIGQEFSTQAKLEQDNNLAVTDMFLATDMVDVVNRELGYYDFIVLPMWKAINEFIPEIRHLVERCEENKSAWQKLKLEG